MQNSDARRMFQDRTKQAIMFVLTWQEIYRGECNLARLNKFCHDVGKKLGLVGDQCGKLSVSLWPIFEKDGFTQRSLYRAGLFIYANLTDIKNGLTLTEIRKSCGSDFNAIIAVNSLIDAGRSKKGRKLWNVGFLVLTGPMAGTDMSTVISDGYLSGLVRVISGAKFSKTVAGIDIFGMKLKCHIVLGRNGVIIQDIDDSWTAGRTYNSKLRKDREECPDAPCERCKKQDNCPNAIKITKGKENVRNNGSKKSGSTTLPVSGEGSATVVSSDVQSSSDNDRRNDG